MPVSAIVPENKASTSASGGPASATKHPKFYFDDGSVVIKVEDTLFKVHKYQLLESETFSDMFKLPKGANNEVEEGSSPEHPIVLNGVFSSDFEALLKVLYTRFFSKTHPSLEASLVVPAFRLAHMWNFADLSDHLLPLAEKVLDNVDKIILARELGIQAWLVPAYIELCRRPEPLNLEEATKLGVQSYWMISRIREQSWPRPTPNSGQKNRYLCTSCAGIYYLGQRDSTATCESCHANRHIVDFNYPGATVKHKDIEAQVKTWVETGCLLPE